MPNALADEKSPYLLQHADQPVEWLPWGEAAFARARAEDRPIFLSIGYSTCHWCHVMAHESFDDPEIAAALNAGFIPVKVDREERPDVDKVYMTYVQAVTGRGGWPLSVWLTPDLKPFYGGTYFPPKDLPARPGFPRVLAALSKGWREDRAKLLAEGDRALEAIRGQIVAEASPPEGEDKPLFERAGTAFDAAFRHAVETFDPEHGGFGGAPKFPRPAQLAFLLRAAALQGPASEAGAEAIRLVTATLQAMARGGIHDHVGGGFHRYAVDGGWFVPHFEKMLYDQAQIAVVCLEARRATGDERYAWMARDILGYVERDLTSPGGACFTAEDADSADAQGHLTEGAFYLWSAAQLRGLLGTDFPLLAAHFGVQDDGNVPTELDPQGEFRGGNILAQVRPLAATAAQLQLDPASANDRLVLLLERLREARRARPRPHLDDKILAGPNGLMLSALALAHRTLGDGGRYLAAATRIAEFIGREMHDEATATLYRVWRAPAPADPCGGRGSTPAFAEDYAAVIQGLLDLYEAGFEIRWLQWAERLQARMDARFWDEAAGGYFNSAADDPSLVLRLKEDYDGAEPAPSSLAALNLLRLGALLGKDAGFRERGVRTIEAFRGRWERAPHAVPQLLCAFELGLESPRLVVLAGDPADPAFQSLAAVVAESFGPRRNVLAADGREGQRWLAERSPWLAELRPPGGRPAAFVCEDEHCLPPVADPAALRELLAVPAGRSEAP